MQIVYYDGQFDDSRLCIALACTAAVAGAAVTNHTEATKLLKVSRSYPAHVLADVSQMPVVAASDRVLCCFDVWSYQRHCMHCYALVQKATDA